MRRLITIIAASTLVLAACGDDTAATTAATTTSPATTTPGATTTDAATITTSGTVGTGSDQIQALLDLYAMTRLRTTYLFGEGDSQQTVILSQDPTADPPVSAVLLESGRIITTPDQTIFCDTAGTGCFAMPDTGGASVLDGLLGPVIGGFLVTAGLTEVPGASIVEMPSVIAGRDGICFQFTPPSGAGFDTASLTQCIDSRLGFTLYVENTPTGGNPERLLELVEFGDPLPDDFTPTGPVAPTP